MSEEQIYLLQHCITELESTLGAMSGKQADIRVASVSIILKGLVTFQKDNNLWPK